jgi:hypothetical protein
LSEFSPIGNTRETISDFGYLSIVPHPTQESKMTTITHSPVARPLTGSGAARQKIDRALNLLTKARADNSSLTDVFEKAHQELEGFEPHVKAIEFDRNDRDVSSHGTALREQAAEADGQADVGKPRQASLETNAEQIANLIDGAMADLGESNSRASYRLSSAKNDIDFARESTIPVTGVSLRIGSRILTEDLDPYLVEVEEDAPGRDVGRFADDIEDLWKNADSRFQSGPIYVDSAERSFVSAKGYLEAARDSL